jgi:hypothetical protein
MVLMNRLLEEKRYNDVLQLANIELNDSLKTLNNQTENRFPSLIFSNIVGHAALELVFMKSHVKSNNSSLNQFYFS